MIKFGERLKELRTERGLTQRDLVKKINNKITQAAIAMWENNLRIPNLEAAAILAQFFGVSLDYIAGLED